MTSPWNKTAGHTRAILLGCFIMAALLSASGAIAQEAEATPSDEAPKYSEKAQELSEAAKEAISKFSALVAAMLDGVEDWIDDMPLYEPPEVLPNGDIIIRRIPDEADEPADDAPESDITDL